jgi:hypothetical protein
MVPPETKSKLPSLRDFRASLKVSDKPLSQEVINVRKEKHQKGHNAVSKPDPHSSLFRKGDYPIFLRGEPYQQREFD